MWRVSPSLRSSSLLPSSALSFPFSHGQTHNLTLSSTFAFSLHSSPSHFSLSPSLSPTSSSCSSSPFSSPSPSPFPSPPRRYFWSRLKLWITARSPSTSSSSSSSLSSLSSADDSSSSSSHPVISTRLSTTAWPLPLVFPTYYSPHSHLITDDFPYFERSFASYFLPSSYQNNDSYKKYFSVDKKELRRNGDWKKWWGGWMEWSNHKLRDSAEWKGEKDEIGERNYLKGIEALRRGIMVQYDTESQHSESSSLSSPSSSPSPSSSSSDSTDQDFNAFLFLYHESLHYRRMVLRMQLPEIYDSIDNYFSFAGDINSKENSPHKNNKNPDFNAPLTSTVDEVAGELIGPYRYTVDFDARGLPLIWRRRDPNVSIPNDSNDDPSPSSPSSPPTDDVSDRCVFDLGAFLNGVYGRLLDPIVTNAEIIHRREDKEEREEKEGRGEKGSPKDQSASSSSSSSSHSSLSSSFPSLSLPPPPNGAHSQLVPYYRLGQMSFNPSHTMMGFTIDLTGNEKFNLYIKSIQIEDSSSSSSIIETITNVLSFAFSRQSQYVYYTQCDSNGRPHVVKCHHIGSPLSTDTIVYVESNPHFSLHLTVSKDQNYLFINAMEEMSSDVLIVDISKDQKGPLHRPFRLFPRRPSIHYSLEHHRGNFLVLTNESDINHFSLLLVESNSLQLQHVDHTSPNYEEVMTHHVSEPSSALRSLPLGSAPLVLIPPRKGVVITGMDCIDGHVILYELWSGRVGKVRIQQIGNERINEYQEINEMRNKKNLSELEQEKVKSMEKSLHHYIPIPAPFSSIPTKGEFPSAPNPSYTLSPMLNHNFRTQYISFSLSSPICPPITYSYDIQKRHITAHPSSPSDAAQLSKSSFYQSYDVDVKVSDDLSIPLTLSHLSHLRRDGRHPVYIEVYGAYGTSLVPSFNPFHLMLIQQGVIVAHAHVRGGGEKGPQWHTDGKGINKQNSIKDFLSCIKYLIINKYTSPGMITAYGESAGGLVVAAAANVHSHLFAGIVMRAPLLDPLALMMNVNGGGREGEGRENDACQSSSSSSSSTSPSSPHDIDIAEFGDPLQSPTDFHYLLSYSPYHTLAPRVLESSLFSPFTSPSSPPRVFPNVYITHHVNDKRIPYYQSVKYVAKLRELIDSKAPEIAKMRLRRMEMERNEKYANGKGNSKITPPVPETKRKSPPAASASASASSPSSSPPRNPLSRSSSPSPGHPSSSSSSSPASAFLYPEILLELEGGDSGFGGHLPSPNHEYELMGKQYSFVLYNTVGKKKAGRLINM